MDKSWKSINNYDAFDEDGLKILVDFYHPTGVTISYNDEDSVPGRIS